MDGGGGKPMAKKHKGLGQSSAKDESKKRIALRVFPNRKIMRDSYTKHDGSSGRPGLPFAFAEKIDNSISATKGNQGDRKIDVYCLFDAADNLVALVFRDNGKGMDGKEDFEGYLELGKDQQIRQKEAMDRSEACTSLETQAELDSDPRASINSNIGQHGQGGKKSAFYMANTERVISCARKRSDRREMNSVWEMRHYLDDDLYHGDKKEYAWDVDLTSRDIGVSTTLLDGEKHPVIIDLIENEEAKDAKKGNGFTMFIITDFVPDVKAFMSLKRFHGNEEDKYREMMEKRLVEDLARTYHYYLHGKRGDQNLPEFSDDEDMSDDEDDDDEEESGGRFSGHGGSKKRKQTSSKGGASTSASAKKKVHNAKSDTEKPVEIVVHAYKENKLKYKASLVDVKTIEVQLMSPEKILRPDNQINDPLELTIRVATDQGQTKLFCLVYYCPFSLNGETRPADEFELLSSKSGVIFSTFWQGRWIPYGSETFSTLKCFENLRGSNDQPIPPELFKRLRVTILCSRRITPDAKKLGFIKNMDSLINHDSTCFMFGWGDETASQLPRVRKKIADFIEDRHARFDREITVLDVMKDDNGKPLSLFRKEADGTQVPITRFTRMMYGKDKNNKDTFYKKDHLVRIQVHLKLYHYGEIAYFECDKLTGERNVTSKATIWYKRLPVEAFGEELISHDVSKKLSLASGDEEAETHLENQVRNLTNQIPNELVAYTLSEEEAGKETTIKNKFNKQKFASKLVANLFKDPVVAGFKVPLVAVYVLSKDGKAVVDVPSHTRNRHKLKISRVIFKTHDSALIDAGNPDGKLEKPSKMDSQVRDSANASGAFLFDPLEDALDGAGKYSVEFHLRDVAGASRDDKVKAFSVKVLQYVVTVSHGEPDLADVTFLGGTGTEKILRLGVSQPSVFKICLRDGFGDKKQREKFIYDDRPSYRAASGNVVKKFPRDTLIEAVDVQPKGLIVNLKEPEVLKKEKGYVQVGVSVKPEKDVIFKHLQKVNPVPVEGSFKLRFTLPAKNGSDTRKEVLYDKAYTFKLVAGDPKEIKFTKKQQLENDALCIENRSFLPEVDVRVMDKYGNFVTVGGDLSNVVHVEITETLTYKGSNPKCKERQVEEAKVQINQQGTATLGKRLIHLSDPPVSEDETHEWKMVAQADLKGGKTKTLVSDTDNDPLTVTISPSKLPYSARPFRSGDNDPECVDGVYRLLGEAGSEVKGIFFKLFDEADNEVLQHDGWKVKWPKTTKEVPLRDGVMPGYKCREQADDELELTVKFIGPSSKDQVGDTFTVDLVLVPYAAGPDHWVWCDKGGQALPKKVVIACDQPMNTKFGMQLRDKYKNVIDLRALNSKFTDPSELIRPMLFFKWVGPERHVKPVDKRGDWETFDDACGTTILPNPTMLFRATVGEYNLEIETNTSTKLKDGMRIKECAQLIEVTPGSPKYLTMHMKGLPNELDAETCHKFGGLKEGPTSMGIVPPEDMLGPSLNKFPSTSVVGEILVQLLDETGNEIAQKGAKDIVVSLHLSSGEVRLAAGNKGSKGLNQKFNGRSNKITFQKVVLEAGTDEATDQAQGKDKLVLSCNIDAIQDVEVPLTFSYMNKILGVEVSPDPYTSQFSVGDRLKKIIVVLRTQDGKGIDKEFAKGLTAKCVQDPNVEEEGVFSLNAEPNWDVEKDGDYGKQFLILPGSKRDSTLKRTGRHWIQVTYKEERPSIISVLGPYEKKSKMLTFNVTSGTPHTLDKRTQVHSFLANQKRVSNAGDRPPAERMILRQPLVLQIRDEHGNECIECSELCVVASIEQSREDVKLEAGEPEACEDIGAPTLDVKYVTEFAFFNDAEAQEKLSQARRKVDADLDLLQKQTRAIEQMNKQLTDVEKSLDAGNDGVAKLRSKASEVGLNPDKLRSAHDCHRMIAHLQQGGVAEGHRAPKVPSYLRAMADEARKVHGNRVLGLLVDLIYVNDDDDASIIAWKSHTGLETLLVDNKSLAMEIYNDRRFRGLLVLGIRELARKWRGKILGDGKLAVGPHHDRKYAWLTDRAACNLVGFHNPQHEYLRAAVVHSLVRCYCIVDEPFTWVVERCEEARSSRVDFPDVVSSRDKRQINSTGVMGGKHQPPRHISENSIYPGQKNMSGLHVQVLQELADGFRRVAELENSLRGLRETVQVERPNLEREKTDKMLAYQASKRAFVEVKDQMQNKRKGGNATGGGEDAGEGTLPELDFVQVAGGTGAAQNGNVGPLGRFVFPSDSQGRVEIANLGLKAGVGNKEGTYKLVCKLFNTNTQEVVQRKYP